ncbi:MAG TPA: hypothetical protein VFR67_05380 [Pilimelia sp.]|nr:hypothetical protein [Pilimelia sp.]
MTATFREVMAGTVRLRGEAMDRSIRLTLAVESPGLPHPLADVRARAIGRVQIAGWADDQNATGTVRIAPVRARRIRYELEFTTLDGRRLRLDGWKSTKLTRPVRTMTELPAVVVDPDNQVVGEARLRFDLRHELLPLLRSFRYQRARPDAAADGPEPGAADPMRSRWRGQAGRLEVWYTTLTDPRTGTGVWLHHELVAPTSGEPAYAHGWAAVFAPDAAPEFARFGPAPWKSPDPPTAFAADGIGVSADRLWGAAGHIGWELACRAGGPPLYTFPRWAWRRELLPAAQIVAHPGATYTGTVRVGESTLDLVDAPGATARIYGHGNAKRWAWLHADLGGGDVCEVVAAVSMRPGLNRLPPLPFVRLRVGGVDLPTGDPLLSAATLRADIGLPSWSVRGRVGERRISIQVTQPPAATLAVDYADPDGTPAVCRNTERADAVIVLERRSAGGAGWEIERRWELVGTAHAEVGGRD